VIRSIVTKGVSPAMFRRLLIAVAVGAVVITAFYAALSAIAH
jgi:hypothetical protein